MGHPVVTDLRGFFDFTEDIVWSVDVDLRLVQFNAAFERSMAQTGISRLLVGMRLDEVLPVDQATIWKGLCEIAQREETLRVELAWGADENSVEIVLTRTGTARKPTGVSIVTRRLAKQEESPNHAASSATMIPEIFANNTAILLLLDAHSEIILDANRAAARYYGHPLERLRGMHYDQINRPLLLSSTLLSSSSLLEARNSAQRERARGATPDAGITGRHRLANGEERDVDIYTSSLEVEGKTTQLCIIHDVTARNRAQQDVGLSEIRYRTIFQTSLDAVLITRIEDGLVVDVNQAFVMNCGSERAEAIGQTTIVLQLWADLDDRLRFVQMLREQGIVRDFEVRFRKKSGAIFWALISASVIELDSVPCVVSVIRNMTGTKEAENEIRNLAFYDPLTELPNRRLLLERLRQPVAPSNPTPSTRAVLFVDLDKFKILNDTLGHQMGDLLLQDVARRLVQCVSPEDTVARLSSDEFVLILEGLSNASEEAAEYAQAVGERVLTALGQPYRLAGRRIYCSASVGIVVFGSGREAAGEVLQQADIALHLAKGAGGNALRFFVPSLQVDVNALAAMEQDMHEAIKAGEFQLYYQPQLNGGRLVGAEALVRWLHPRQGLLTPHAFIGLAEKTGLILPLGEWVLRAACEQIALWGKTGNCRALTVAINISARQLQDKKFVATVLNALESSGARPQCLKLELTESMLVDNLEDVIQKMTELNAHGVGFSLDDFGTGYSSLSYLKRLPLTQLKIDQSFVRDILLDVSSYAIAQAIISLGHAMGLSVIAEGVETVEQEMILNRLGCNYHQGYLFSRPLPLDEFERFVSSEPTLEESLYGASGPDADARE